tara:strand:+ start:1538 stop:1978 length:441 start_codon:yes stop_codon:yes gene_type:complete
MGMATHLGPWLLGTVKEGAGRNTGVTVVAQSFDLAFGTLTGSPIILPAGAMVTHVTIVTTAVFSAATTIFLSINGTAFTTTGTITSVGGVNLNANATTPGGWLNVGATDATIAYTMAGAGLTTGTATLFISYAVRNSNGSSVPASA